MSNHHRNLAAAPAPAAPPLPADPKKALEDAFAAAARSFGMPDSDPDAVIAMINACLAAVAANSPAAIEATALRAGLSKREAVMLSTMPRASVASVGRYVANKRAMKR